MDAVPFALLDRIIDGHEACDNEFFDLGRNIGWTREQLEKYSLDYRYWIRAFPGILAALIGRSPDPEFQFFMTQILHSELGSGDRTRMHFRLFERILRKLGLSDAEIESGPKFEETRWLVSGMFALYGDKDLLRAMGAQYALEKQAFPMIEKLYLGFKHYKELTRDDLEYFELHLVEEPEHLACMQECMARCVESPSDASRVEAGALACLDLIAAFWRRMYAEVTRVDRGGLLAARSS